MIQALVMILAFGALNRLRGSDVPFTSKGVTSAASGITAGGCAFWLGYAPVVAGLIGIVVFLGILIWAIPGWGKYFCVLHGRDTRKEREIGWIDKATDKIANHYLRGMLAMSLRGLYLAPLFVALSLLAPPFSFLITPLCLLQGPAYAASRVVPEPWRVAFSEALWGGAMGLMVWLSLWMGV